MSEVFIADAVRTPIGRYNGALASVRPDDLGAVAVRGLVARNDSLDPARIDDVIFGDANAAGEDNATSRAWPHCWPTARKHPRATVNRLCGSGMQAVIDANREIAVAMRRYASPEVRVDDPCALGPAEA